MIPQAKNMPNMNTFAQKTVSVVLPIYNEEGNIAELLTRVEQAISGFGEYEIICIDDGSRDASPNILSEQAAKNPHVKVLTFSRNFGHQIAITAGLDYAEGNAVIIMDSDLQDPPEVIPDMIRKWQEGFEVVYGKRRTRDDASVKRWTAFLFYRLLHRLANISIPEDTGDFRLLDRRVVLEMRKLREHSRFMRGLTSWVGYRQTAIEFERGARNTGVTHYPFMKMLKFALDGITSFSTIPLRLATYCGFASAGIGFVWGLYALYRRFFLPPSETVTGWTTIVIAIFFLGGIQLIILGIVGEYIGRIFIESQHRPLYLVRSTQNIKNNPSPPAA